MKMHVSEWYLHAACYGKCRIALVMFLSHLWCWSQCWCCWGISSSEVFQGTADKRVVRRVKKKRCFPSLSFPVNRLSSSSSVSLCNFLIIPTALQVGDLVRKRDLRCVSLSLLCSFTNQLKHFCFASDRPTGLQSAVVLLYKCATGIVPYVVVSKPCHIFQSRSLFKCMWSKLFLPHNDALSGSMLHSFTNNTVLL